MQKKLIHSGLSFLIISTLLMSGCESTQEDSAKSSIVQSENALWETQEKTDSQSSKTDSDTKDTDLNSQDDGANESPSTVKDCYTSYKEVLKNHFPQYTLSEIKANSVNDSKFFSFSINTKGGTTQPEVTFQNDEYSFSISLPDNIDNEILKDVILCTIMSTDTTIDLNSASELMQNLSNSFDGSSNSNVISTTNFIFQLVRDCL